jgi:hypothetical protein
LFQEFTMKRCTLLAATAASGLAAMPFASMAQAYPSKQE